MPSCARQPVNADSSAGGVTPKLDELLDGEDAGKILDAASILGMEAFQLRI
jgi:hypothetical protein